MFQVIAIACLAGAVLAAALHYLAAARRRAARPRRAALGRWSKLVYAVLMASLAVLAVTGLYPALRGERLGGWLLMVHVSFGGVFAAALAAAALTSFPGAGGKGLE